MPEGTPEQQRIIDPGRRLFLKAVLGTAALVMVDGWRALDATQREHPTANNQATNTEQPSHDSGINPFREPLENYDQKLQDKHDISDTVTDSLKLTAINFGYGALANNKYTGLYSGNSGAKEIVKMYRENRLKTASKMVVYGPVIEETLFRALPAVMGKKKSIMPFRGIVSTYLFGKMHQLTKRPEELSGERPGLVINKNMVPVPQYAMGAFYWMIARRRGMKHSMIAHATTNSVVLPFLEIGNLAEKIKPKETNSPETK